MRHVGDLLGSLAIDLSHSELRSDGVAERISGRFRIGEQTEVSPLDDLRDGVVDLLANLLLNLGQFDLLAELVANDLVALLLEGIAEKVGEFDLTRTAQRLEDRVLADHVEQDALVVPLLVQAGGHYVLPGNTKLSASLLEFAGHDVVGDRQCRPDVGDGPT